MTSSSSSQPTIPFTPLTTFTNDHFGYHIKHPEPWTIKDGNDGNSIEISDSTDLAFLKVVANRTYDNGYTPSLEDRLPGAVGITTHEKRRTTHDDQPALRFERSYLATGNGPTLRVNGLILDAENHLFTVQCGVVVSPFADPHTTRTPPSDVQPWAVEWTSTINEATASITESFTHNP